MMDSTQVTSTSVSAGMYSGCLSTRVIGPLISSEIIRAFTVSMMFALLSAIWLRRVWLFNVTRNRVSTPRSVSRTFSLRSFCAFFSALRWCFSASCSGERTGPSSVVFFSSDMVFRALMFNSRWASHSVRAAAEWKRLFSRNAMFSTAQAFFLIGTPVMRSRSFRSSAIRSG